MPIYEYSCTKCGQTVEVMQKISDSPLTECPKCGGELTKMISSTSFILKGTGWYATDYAKKGSSSSNGSGNGKRSDVKDYMKDLDAAKDTPAPEKSADKASDSGGDKPAKSDSKD